MFRAMSTRKGRRGYDQLISEPTVDDLLSEPQMIRSTTLPPNFFGDFPMNYVSGPKVPAKVDFIEKQVKKVSKVHPLFSLFERRSRKKKATAKPEFSSVTTLVINSKSISDMRCARRIVYKSSIKSKYHHQLRKYPKEIEMDKNSNKRKKFSSCCQTPL
ncbi:hypothetical protein LXL04_013758 [Taraxacum kok-saghyz]